MTSTPSTSFSTEYSEHEYHEGLGYVDEHSGDSLRGRRRLGVAGGSLRADDSTEEMRFLGDGVGMAHGHSTSSGEEEEDEDGEEEEMDAADDSSDMDEDNDDEEDDDDDDDESEDNEGYATVQDELLEVMHGHGMEFGAGGGDGVPLTRLPEWGGGGGMFTRRLFRNLSAAEEEMEQLMLLRREGALMDSPLRAQRMGGARRDTRVVRLEAPPRGVFVADDWLEMPSRAPLAVDPAADTLRPYTGVSADWQLHAALSTERSSAAEPFATDSAAAAAAAPASAAHRRPAFGPALSNALLYGTGARCPPVANNTGEVVSGICRSEGTRMADGAGAAAPLLLRQSMAGGDCGLGDAFDSEVHDMAEALSGSSVFNEALGQDVMAVHHAAKATASTTARRRRWPLADLLRLLTGSRLHPYHWDVPQVNAADGLDRALEGDTGRCAPQRSVLLPDDALEAMLGLPLGRLISQDRTGAVVVCSVRGRRQTVSQVTRALFGNSQPGWNAPSGNANASGNGKRATAKRGSAAAFFDELETLLRDERVRRERQQLEAEVRHHIEQTVFWGDVSSSSASAPVPRSASPHPPETSAGAEATMTHPSPTPPAEPAPATLPVEIAVAPAPSPSLSPAPATTSTEPVDPTMLSRTTGIDPTVLVELPSDMRREVIQQHLGQIRDNQAFLSALPENVRHEVQEVAGQAAWLHSAASDMDNASFLATLPPVLREEIFLTSDEHFINSLPPHLSAEARYVRDRHRVNGMAPLAAAEAEWMRGDASRPGDTAAAAAAAGAVAARSNPRSKHALPFLTRLEVFERALRSPGVCGPLLANTVRVLCYDVSTRLALVRMAMRLLECRRPDDASVAGRSAELLSSLFKFSVTIAHDLRHTETTHPLCTFLAHVPEAVQHGGRHRARLVEALVSMMHLYFQILVEAGPTRTVLLQSATAASSSSPDEVDRSSSSSSSSSSPSPSPSTVPAIDASLLTGLSLVLRLPEATAKTRDKVLTMYEWAYRNETNRAAIVQCLVESATALAPEVCAAMRDEPGLRGCEAQFARLVRTLAELVRPDLRPLQALQPVWTALEAALEAANAARPSLALSQLAPMLECYLSAHTVRLPDWFGSATDTDTAAAADRPPHEVSAGQPPASTSAAERIDRRLAAFLERHATAINRLLYQNPALIQGPFRAALAHPRFLDFENKKLFFRSALQEQRRLQRSPPIRLLVRRDSVFEDSYHQLRPRSAAELKGRLNVQFVGEEGIDAGGLTREWYVILARKIFDENYALFRRSVGKSGAFHINASSHINEDHLGFFRFIGRFIGKALWDGQLLDAYFVRSVYKHMIGVRPSYHDIEAIDPEYYSSLTWVLQNDITEVLELGMSAEVEEFGEVKVIDLVPDGRHIPVTEHNKREYVRLITDLKMTRSIEPQLQAFLAGFHELIPRSLVSLFTDYELELLISGLPEIDIADLKMHTQYHGYRASSPQIQWFWEAVAALDRDDRARLLMFVTGSSKVPLGGFAYLPGMSGGGGIQRFQIHRVAGDTDRLPSAHTCFNQLDLPEYADRDKLRERLLTAIREGSEGFGFG